MTKPPLGWSKVPETLTIKRVEETVKVSICDNCGDRINPGEPYGECRAILYLADEIREGMMEYHEKCQPPQVAAFLGIATRREKPDSEYETAPRPEPPPEARQPEPLAAAPRTRGPLVAGVVRSRKVEHVAAQEDAAPSGGADCEVNPLTEGAEGRT